MRIHHTLVVLILGLIAFCSSGCSKGGESGSVPSGAQNANGESDLRPLYVQESARGDIERARLAVERALDNARHNKIPQAIESLNAAAQDIAKTTTTGRPDQSAAVRFQTQIDEIKGFIDAALNSARSGSADTTARIEVILTAIGALKTQMGQ